ncbi:MAG: ABC transporter ATP-binding protein [Flavobacteriales bacterium]|nr:MAG: ABC transporter ATP-binding protein [Flavobacteriales bacterium]
MSTVLSTSGLVIGFGHRRLIHALDMHLRAGELVSILGRNGSGKSTLLRTLVGALEPLEGNIRIVDQDLTGLSAHQRAMLVAAVFPGRTTAGQVTVHEALAMARYARTGWRGQLNNADEQALLVASRSTGIDGWQHRPLNTLSDGEYQRVMIARAIAQETPLVLFDEPTAFLDLSARVSIMGAFSKLTRNLGKAVLITTHDLDSALGQSDRLLIVRSDGTCWLGTPREALVSGIIAREFKTDGVVFDPARRAFRPE